MSPVHDAAQARILNVDDNDGARYVKARVLRMAGYTVIEATSGLEALEKVRTEAPDLVLLDVKLPDLNGREVCRRIKSDPATATTLVLQTSASLIDTVSRVKALDAGADSFLVEPIEPEELVASVGALLRLRRAEQARRRAESALDESEARFRQMAEVMSDVFWIVERDTCRFLYVSPAYQAHWRRDPGVLYGGDIKAWFSHVHEDDLPALRGHFDRLCRDGTAYELEYRIRDADGAERWIAERAFVIHDDLRRERRVAGVSQDITLRKQLELGLIEADRQKDQFLAMLSHELRSPLAPIRSAIEGLALNQRRGDPVDPKFIAIVQRQVDHLSHLVDELLDVSRINHGKIELKREPVALRAVLAAALTTAEAGMSAKGHAVHADWPATPVWVDGDFTRLLQVFGNLLNNAAKFTPDGGEVRIGYEVEGDRVKVRVADTGIGIRAEFLPRIFDIFIQEDGSLDRAQGGLGLGLSLVKRLTELHGGEVSVRSEGLGRGSEFVVTLPVCAPPPARPGVPRASGSETHLRILVVDDNADSAEAMALVLQAKGHELATAASGEAAIATAATMRPDLVLLDIGLPGINGYEAAARLRSAPETAGAVLVALTGYGTDYDRQRAARAGFDHHLVKPADFDRLYAIIDGLRPAEAV